ncbi:MAG: polyprenyl diphosphate synthase [Candidatus Limnocylindrales bacterium]
MARTPLARPTDAPPIAHAPSAAVRSDPAQTGVDVPERLASAEETPRHVAIIMDGNRRWARAHGLTELEGHAAGVETIRALLKHAVRRGIPILSLYAFSRENWARTDEEVSGLFVLLESAIRDETDELRRQGVRIRLLGRLEELPEETQHSIDSGLSATAQGERLLLNIAFNYAGRTEIVDAVRRIVASGLPAGQVDERAISDSLYTVGLPDPDLVIRTGGDQRMSNFLVWQAAYAEFYFCSKLWPDFDAGAFDAALIDYASRLRRFGR